MPRLEAAWTIIFLKKAGELSKSKTKMFVNGTRKWLSNRTQGSASKQPGKAKKTKTGNGSSSSSNNINISSGSSRSRSNKCKKWPAKILKQHRERLLKELDVNKLLPHLVYHRVFSLGEYKEILAHQNSCKQAEVFLDQLSAKGPTAFGAFCSVLEEVNPHLLTCLLLDDGGIAGLFLFVCSFYI